LKIYCLVPKRAENQRLLFKFGGPLGEPTEPLVNQRPKILFKILVGVKTNEPLAFPYTALSVGPAGWTGRHRAPRRVLLAFCDTDTRRGRDAKAVDHGWTS